MFDIRWPLNYIPLLNKKCVVWWGGWLTNNEIANKIKVFLMKKNIKSILYSEFHKEQFISLGVPKSNMIVANNSIHISNRLKSFLHKKKTIVFSGSFNKRKKLDKLIDIFNECLKLIPKKITLILVGDGLIFDEIKDKIISLNLEDRIKLYGKITNSRDLSKIYKSAFCSVSYGQAGLSVLQSLGFGVPFICPNDAISGGEIYNIKSGHNGFLTVSDDDFKNKIIEICNNEDYAIKLGKNAFNYYTSECTIKNMSQKFFEIISDLK
jgi:glycosyltransferase involved in cell wall biosynthesis